MNYIATNSKHVPYSLAIYTTYYNDLAILNEFSLIKKVMHTEKHIRAPTSCDNTIHNSLRQKASYISVNSTANKGQQNIIHNECHF